jgi:Zn-dependent protease with chaperone function
MLGAELVLAAIIGAWISLLGRRLRPAIAAQRELERLTTPVSLDKCTVRVLASRDVTEAFVAGPLQPLIFVSRGLLDDLDPDELDAVLLHEEHHRRTRAPLREMALASWSRLVGGLPWIRRWIERRIAYLEIDADRYALRAGASRAAIASALIKVDRSDSFAGIGFAPAANLRLRWLVGGALTTDDHAAIPMEWLAPAVLGVGLGVCHVFLG